MKPYRAAAWALGGALVGALALHLATRPAAGPGDSDGAPAAVAADAAGDGMLHLDADARTRAGIGTTAVTGTVLRGERSGYARAMDLSPLASIAAEISSASAAADASGREAQRLAQLVRADQSASPRELEAARAQATADRARLALACQRVGLEYGAGLMRLGCSAMVRLVRAAAGGGVVVLRIDMPGSPLPAGSVVQIGSGADAASVRVLGPAVGGDAQLQTPGVLALLRGPVASRASIGRVLPARMPTGGGVAGVLIPRSAIVRADAGQFVYRAIGKDGFERVPITAGTSVEAGWILPAGVLKPGDTIVVTGAGTLLGLERAAPAAAD